VSTSHRDAPLFSSIRLANWRNFREASVELRRRIILVGPNASGKSNFLDAFKFLRDVAAVGGGFEQAIRRRGSVTSLRCLAARRYSDVEIDVEIQNLNGAALWEYELAFGQDNQRRPIIKHERIARDGQELLSRPDDADMEDPELLRQTHLEQVRANKGFRELATFFQSVQYLHVVPQLLRDPDRYRGQATDPFGWDLLERVSKTPKKTRNSWLRRIREALQVAVPQLKDLELSKDDRGVAHLRGKYAHWRPQGAWQSEETFSDGTLRLFGLLWSVLDGTGPLLLEEPELSLHPGVVQFIPQMLARMQRRTGRQVLMSSHSADLLRDEGLGVDEVVVLQPSAEGTTVVPAGSLRDVRRLLEAGVPLADTVLPHTRPPQAEQLSLFSEL
jgi:predicted ATPase